MSRPRYIKQFFSDQRASLSLEAVLIFPILIWAYFGMFILFEGFRALGTNTRASYTIADLLSRETNYVTPAYLTGMNNVLNILTQSRQPTVLRVSVVSYNDDENAYELEWSHKSAGVHGITEATLEELLPHIPNMANPGVAIVVETYMAFIPFMNIALDPIRFESVTVTRPRFANQLVWADS